MRARARIATELAGERSGSPLSRVSVLRSQAPLVLRPTLPKGPEPLTRRDQHIARLSVAAGAAGPLGGDDLALDVRVGAGSTLLLNDVSATLLLPGARGGRSRMRMRVVVEDGGTFVWLPEPVIAARGCDHIHEIDVDLARGARLLMRDEIVMGRHRESAGDLSQRVRVRRDGAPLYHQQLALGPAWLGWDSAAVIGRHKAVGTVLIVDPEWIDGAPGPVSRGTVALLPLAGPGAVISALAEDTLALRRALDAAVSLLGDPWAAAPAAGAVAATPAPSAPVEAERMATAP